MSDFGQRLLGNISYDFIERIQTDRKLRQIANRVRDGTSYGDASEYAVRLGELLSEALNGGTHGLAFMSEEVARELLEPLLSYDHAMISDVIQEVQSNMNAEVGVGLTVRLPELDTNRIDGLVEKIAGYESFDEARWLIDEPIVNFSQSVIDQAIRDNAEIASKAGLRAKIVRKAEPAGTKTRKIGKRSYTYQIPCRWCASLAGTYDYKSAPEEVYHRHAFCRCSVTYMNGKERQDVWTKAKWTGDDAKAAQEAIQAKTEELTRKREADARRRANTISEIDQIQTALGFSKRGASIFRTVNLQRIRRYGLDRVIEAAKTDRAYTQGLILARR